MAHEANDWWRGAVIYQIYPRSFADSDGDGVGDLPGIIERLDYVASLGVDGIWLSPFFPSPMKDFGYDVADYCGVDPLFGTLDDFDALVDRAHALGLKVIIDQVYSHTSDRHPWFVESAASRQNPKADWYVWADAKPEGSPPNNWQAAFGGPSWSWSARRRQYYLHNFLIEQPDLNFWNPAVQEAILAAADFLALPGELTDSRLDVIKCSYFMTTTCEIIRRRPTTGRQPRRPVFSATFSIDRDLEALAFLGRLRRLMDAYGATMSVGEVVDDPPLPRQQEYTTPPDRLHTAYGFHFRAAKTAEPALYAGAR